MIKLSELKISKEDNHDIWCFCPAHDDTNTPNFLVSKTGKYAGYGKCFACGYYVKVGMEGRRKIVKAQRIPNPINWFALQKLYHSNYLTGVKSFDKWDVDISVLHQLQIGWDGECHTIPVFSNKKTIVGIQRFYEDNNKKLVYGSRVGVFLPVHFSIKHKYTFIAEGAHDIATLLDLGVNSIGRLSCKTGNDIIINMFNSQAKDSKTIIIIPDNDDEGKGGGAKLATQLLSQRTYVIIPEEGNDFSDFVQLKGKVYVKNWLKEKMQQVS